MELSEKSFQILDALDRNEVFNQRQLAEHSGVSLAQVNYLLKRLLEKGLVKVRNFQKNPNKSFYLVPERKYGNKTFRFSIAVCNSMQLYDFFNLKPET